MFKGKISITYHKDWSIDLINTFNCNITFIYTQNSTPYEVIDLFRITNLNSNHSSKSILNFLSKYNEFSKVECLDNTKNYILIKTKLKMKSLTNNQHFVKHSCFQVGNIQMDKTAEIWTFFTPKKENIKTLITELKENNDRDIKVLSITKYSLHSKGLTDKQYFYFEYLYRNGYFQIPKKITLDVASKELNTTPTNINKHVNRAVKKIVEAFFKEE